MDLEYWENLNQKYHIAHKHIVHLRENARDCIRMSHTVYELLKQADRERVVCRRSGKITPKYENLMLQAEEALKNFEGHLLMAKLMTKDPR